MDTAVELEQVFAKHRERERRWRPRARYVHDPSLPPNTWMVDGEVQEGPLTEETLGAQLLREGKGKKEVRVSAPQHVALAGIIGFFPALA